MAYAKVAKVCQDAPVPYQHVNQLIDNWEALRTAYTAAHGKGSIVFQPLPDSPLDLLGVHNHNAIPRAIMVCDSSAAGTSSRRQGSATFNQRRVVSAVTRLAVGVWWVTVLNLGQQGGGFRGECTPNIGSGAAARVCVPLTYYGTTPGFPDFGVFVDTLELSSGDFVLTDYPFTFTLLGEP